MPVPARLVLPAFFLVIVMGATVLGPLIYCAMQPVWPAFPFHRAMDRALLISALAGLGLFWRRIEFGTLWPWNSGAWKQVLLGLVIAFVAMQALMGFDLAVAGFHSSGLGADAVVKRVLLALVAAVIVAPAEETVFRGFLQRELARGLGWRAGWILAAATYALAHFLNTSALDKTPVHWWSGAAAWPVMFAQVGADLASPENVVKALNLFLLGLILGGVFLRAGSLWVNAGLHGALIFGLLLFTGLTRPDEPPRVAGLGGNIVSSFVTTVVLIILGLWLWRYYRHPSVQPEPVRGSGANAP
jgi:membrane protease YdiL (CAAX protease family)